MLIIPLFVLSQTKSSLGFQIDDPLIPISAIKQGGPPKDGIPSIDQPVFARAKDYTFFDNDQRILGVYHNGIAKAYPIGILNWHEIVNDRFGEEAVVVTYCPLCGSGLAFLASIEGRTTEFGVSGLLYNSDVLLYDRDKESLWSQILMKAVSGPHKGKELVMVHTDNTTLGEWKMQYPDTDILTDKTGFSRDYLRSPYGDYNENESLFFPVSHNNTEYHPKELVLGLIYNGQFKAYPFKELKRLKEGKGKEVWQGKSFHIHFDKKSESARILDDQGIVVPTVTLFWFAWYTFHPDTEVFKKK